MLHKWTKYLCANVCILSLCNLVTFLIWKLLPSVPSVQSWPSRPSCCRARWWGQARADVAKPMLSNLINPKTEVSIILRWQSRALNIVFWYNQLCSITIASVGKTLCNSHRYKMQDAKQISVREDPVSTMQKARWTMHSSFLVSLWIWSLEGSQQPFSFFGRVTTNKRMNKQPGDNKCDNTTFWWDILVMKLADA